VTVVSGAMWRAAEGASEMVHICVSDTTLQVTLQAVPLVSISTTLSVRMPSTPLEAPIRAMAVRNVLCSACSRALANMNSIVFERQHLAIGVIDDKGVNIESPKMRWLGCGPMGRSDGRIEP